MMALSFYQVTSDTPVPHHLSPACSSRVGGGATLVGLRATGRVTGPTCESHDEPRSSSSGLSPSTRVSGPGKRPP